MVSNVVDFKIYGWDWVIAPRTVDIGKAEGTCNTFEFSLNAKEAYYHLAQGAYQAKCVPTDFKSMMIIYIDDNEKIYVEVLRDAIVDKADCR